MAGSAVKRCYFDSVGQNEDDDDEVKIEAFTALSLEAFIAALPERYLQDDSIKATDT